MKHIIRIHLYGWKYHVEVKRKFLWVFPYWESLFTSSILREAERFYTELIEGKHDALLESSRKN